MRQGKGKEILRKCLHCSPKKQGLPKPKGGPENKDPSLLTSQNSHKITSKSKLYLRGQE
jgi:hypothetical protein